MPFVKCVSCDKQKRSKDEKFFPLNNIQDPLTVINNMRQFCNSKKRKLNEVSDIISDAKFCRACYQLWKNSNVSTDVNEPDLSIYRKGLSSHSRCTFSCQNSNNLIMVPPSVCRDLLMTYKFFVPSGARMCSEHVGIANYWPYVKQGKEVPSEEQASISDLMWTYYQELKSEKQIVFDMNNIDYIDDNTFEAWFAYNKMQFKEICTYTEKINPVHVGVLLCKLRTALSNKQISFLFGVCERTIGNYIKLAIEDLMKQLVPKFINCNDRTVLTNHVTPMAKTLFDIPDNKTCLIFDATYRLVKKSKNYSGQKQLWSEQKKMPLIKPMVGCTSDGWVQFVLGPYDATHNDATILKDCFDRYPSEMNVIHENDVMLVDRGFRDVINFLKESKGLKVHCPGLGQLNTLDANLSRFITKCRWIIEQLFGRLKAKFPIFAIPAHNSTLIHDYQALLIAFALLNLFHQPILSDRTHEDVAVLMKSRLHIPNQLQCIVEKFNLSKVRTSFLQIEYVALDNVENNQQLCFPQLTLNDLYDISLGPYQLQNAISYYAEHQKEGIFLVSKFQPNPKHKTAAIKYTDFNITIQDPVLIKAYMKSRYRGGKHHHIFVLFDKTLTGRDSIKEYFCTCESGARTVGCCSHIMTIIWFLGYGQYHEISVPNPEICDVSITIPKQIPQPMEIED